MIELKNPLSQNLWLPAAAVTVLLGARLICVGLSRGEVAWAGLAADVILVGLTWVAAAWYIRLARRSRREAEAAKERVDRLEMVSRELIDHEATLRNDLVRMQGELNERMVRLAALLDVTRELFSVRKLDGVLQRIVDTARSVLGAETAVLEISDPGHPFVMISGSQEYQPASLFKLSAPVAAAGEEIGSISLYYSGLGPGASDTPHLLALGASFAGAAYENARLYRDLSDANVRLEQAQKNAERLIQEIPVGIVALDRDYRVTTWNRTLADTIGIPASEALGREIWHLLGPQADELLIRSAMQSWKDPGEEGPHTCEVNDAAGGNRVLRLVASSVESLHDQGKGVVVIVEDVTEKVRLGEQIKNAEKLKLVGEFAAGMAHEINNPIGIISACAEVMGKKLARHGPEFEEFVKTSKIIEDEAIRCSSIVKNLLGFARQSEMSPAEVNVAAVVSDTVELVRGRTDAANIDVSLEIADDIPRVVGDAHQLKQVFLNLSMNAIEAMPDGGRLDIAVGRKGDSVMIGFADTGPGVDIKSVTRLFSPFYTSKPSGTGLGLPLSHGIVERHGGHIHVDNVDGAGARFTVELPLNNTVWQKGV